MHGFSSGVGAVEDLAEVLVSNRGEVRAIFRCNAENHGVGGQSFALALRHVFGKLVHHAVHGEPGLAAVAQRSLGRATVGARGHAEGGVAGSTVGGGSQEVSRSPALAFEQHVAPAAVRATRRFCHGVDRDCGEQSTQKNPFHSFVLFLSRLTNGQGFWQFLASSEQHNATPRNVGV